MTNLTPEALKAYVEGALSQRQSFDLLYFIGVPILAALAVALTNYLQEKGKNRATKEDIGKITTEIESSKAVFSERLEGLKADLSARGQFSKARYEHEMKVFEEIWPKLCAVRDAALSLRPVMDSSLAEGETQESRKQTRLGKLSEAYGEFARGVEHSRPFYPAEIWKELRALLDLFYKEGVEYQILDMQRDWQKYWDSAQANAKAISEQIDKICEAIRSRLTKFD